LPTFAIAVGRRLGYPLKLVLAPNHTLYRWEDGDEAFNLQHTSGGGEVYPDEYFHEWPRTWTETDYAINERTKVWLHSMTPKQEVSKFLCNRAIFLCDIGRFDEAIQAVKAAERFNPINPACGEIQFTILAQMQYRSYVQPAQPTTAPTAIGLMQACIDAGHGEMFAAVDAIASHRADSRMLHARAGGTGEPRITKIQKPRG
jgi:hypothetical protein